MDWNWINLGIKRDIKCTSHSWKCLYLSLQISNNKLTLYSRRTEEEKADVLRWTSGYTEHVTCKLPPIYHCNSDIQACRSASFGRAITLSRYEFRVLEHDTVPLGKHRRFGESRLESDVWGKLLRTEGNYLPIDTTSYTRNSISWVVYLHAWYLTASTCYVIRNNDTCCLCLHGRGIWSLEGRTQFDSALQQTADENVLT